MKICILNASNPSEQLLKYESDVYQDYRDGRASCFVDGECVKQCRSWHSWSYALETEFFVYLKSGWEGVYKYDGVILLCNRNPELLIPLVKKLKLMKKKVAVSFHEGGQDLAGGSGLKEENIVERWIGLSELVREVNFYVNLFGQLQPFFSGWFGEDKVKYCAHSVPFDWTHGFRKAWSERPYDILVGTRTLNQRLSRNTIISLGVLNGIAQKKNLNVHYLSEDGPGIEKVFKKMGLTDIVIHQGPLEWVDWLKFLSNFRFVCHADNSLNLAQIVYDCMMVDTLCVGSTCWNNIQLGTQDGADYRNWERLLASKPTGAVAQEFFANHHPDTVKRKLIELFV